MKNVKLISLRLDHFQGGSITIDANGDDLSVYGRNSSGKTRIVSAMSWLLWGKDSLGRSEFSVKDLNEQGEVAQHGIDHIVEAVLSVNGEQTALKKVFREKWVKAKGRPEATFSGHQAQYYVNLVPRSEKEYKEIISEIAGTEETFRLLTSPVAFPALPWQRQRAILLDVVGDLTSDDVIASNPKLSPLIILLEGFKKSKDPFEDMKKTIIAKRVEINKELPQIAIRVDECRRGIPDVTGMDRAAEEAIVSQLELTLNDRKLRLQGINTGGNISSLMAKLTGLNLELRELEENHRKGDLSTLNHLNQRISEIEAQLSSSRSQAKRLEGEIAGKERQIQRIEPSLLELREKWGLIDAETFQDTTTLTCAACGQALPVDRVQAAREKALGRFNEDKAERLKAVIEKGAALKEEKQRISGEVEAIKTEKNILDEKIPRLEDALKQTNEDRDVLKRNSEDFSGIQGRAEIMDEIEDVNIQIKEERDGKAQDVEKIQLEIGKLNTDLVMAKTRVDAFVRREQGEARIEQLKDEEKSLSKEFEKLEGELWLIDLFIKTKVSLLTEKINSKFEIVRFKLFSQLVNGGIEECCVITVGGVPIDGGLNNAARINAGLDIVRTLQAHYALKAPVFCDNAEAVNTLIQVGCQMIRLYVSDDRQLRIEVAHRKPDRKAA